MTAVVDLDNTAPFWSLPISSENIMLNSQQQIFNNRNTVTAVRDTTFGTAYSGSYRDMQSLSKV